METKYTPQNEFRLEDLRAIANDPKASKETKEAVRKMRMEALDKKE